MQTRPRGAQYIKFCSVTLGLTSAWKGADVAGWTSTWRGLSAGLVAWAMADKPFGDDVPAAARPSTSLLFLITNTVLHDFFYTRTKIDLIYSELCWSCFENIYLFSDASERLDVTPDDTLGVLAIFWVLGTLLFSSDCRRDVTGDDRPNDGRIDLIGCGFAFGVSSNLFSLECNKVEP